MRALPLTLREWIPLWDRWWLLIPLIGLLAIEWLLRRSAPFTLPTP
jgi:hypothetical protein